MSARLDAATEPAAFQTVELLRLNGKLRLFLTIAEVAELCGVSRKVVQRWIEDGTISHARRELGTSFYPIPVRELAKLQDLAAPTGTFDSERT